MNLDDIRDERNLWLEYPNVKLASTLLEDIKKINSENCSVDLDSNFVKIDDNDSLNDEEKELIKRCAKELIPWRKGPFDLANLKIDAEWQSDIKYDYISNSFDLKDKIVGDIGCNNGYYMFRFMQQNPKIMVGFDPSTKSKLQFDLINHFCNFDIKFELLGVEHLEFYEHKFDFLFMLGVLYHRSDPISTLKTLCKALNKNGEILIDTFIIDGDEEVALSPKKRYAQMRNVYFVPTVNCLKNWLDKAGFDNIEVIGIKDASIDEQRVTNWTYEQSLENFLDENNEKTVEGYDKPKRVYLKAKKR